jgi:hypothetical protein
MNSSFQDFLSQPLWFTIPLIAIYFGLMVYIIHFIWKHNKNN